MALSTNSSDPLVSLLAQTKAMHELENQNMSQEARDSLWKRRVESLTNALLGGSSPTNPTMPSPPNTSTLTPPPMARAHSIAVLEPTQAMGRSLSPSENLGMSRKRSAPGATPATPNDHARASASETPTSVKDPFDDFTASAASKMQRTASGRRPCGPLRIRSPPFRAPNEQQATPVSAASSDLASPFTRSPNTPYGCTPPNSAFSTASFESGPEPFQRAQRLMPPSTNRNENLSGPFYHQMTHMNISPPNFDQRHQSIPRARSLRSAAQGHSASPFELDPSSLAAEHGSTLITPPISIPQAHLRDASRRALVNEPRTSYLPSMLFVPSTIEDKRSIAARMLAPRPSLGALDSRSPSSSPEYRSSFHPATGSIKVEGGVEKYQIARLERPRVEKQKLFCDQCDKQPDGFRGAHELQRHKEAQHARVRKVWVCIDDSEDGQMLSSCKKCRAMKTYPAYYNAAAHLRRMHFKPKPEVAQKGTASRAGSGGGDDPPIEILKRNWMKQVLEVNGKIVDQAEADWEDVKDGLSSKLDHAATEAADRAVPHLSSTADSVRSFEVLPAEESHDFPNFDYDSMTLPTIEAPANSSRTGRGFRQDFCAVVSSTNSSIIDAAASFAGDLDFAELFPVPDFFPPA